MKKYLVIFLAFCILLMSLLLADGFFFAPNRLKVTQTMIQSEKISPSLSQLKIAYVSDMHLNEFYSEKRLTQVVDQLNQQAVDVVLFGGDLLSSLDKMSITPDQQDWMIAQLKSIKAPLGKFAVKGSQDDYTETIVTTILKQAEFEYLDNKLIRLYKNNDFLQLIGVNAALTQDQAQSLLDVLDDSKYTLAISHQPNLVDYLKGDLVPLMMSGFTHGGQINIPFLKDHFTHHQPYLDKTQMVSSTRLDISNGVGVTMLELRLFADPEINIYTFMSSTK